MATSASRRACFALLLGCIGLCFAAQQGQLAPATRPIVFENLVDRSGITFRTNNGATARHHQIEAMLAGVAIFDYNNDGLMDLYFVNGAHLPDMDKSDPSYWNRLYRNNGDGTFTDVTEKAGVRGIGFGMGVAAADYDNDGWVDLYVTGVDHNQLFHNNGDGTFTDVTARAGVAAIHPKLGKTWSIAAGWFDYDNDGKLDLMVINYVNWSLQNEPLCKSGEIVTYCTPDAYTGQPNMLFHNNGDGTFKDVSVPSGIDKFVGKGMGVAFADYDGDGFVDAFVSNDTYRNFLFHNQRDGTFREEGVRLGVAYNENGKSIAGMGTDFRDVDNDGRPDIFVVGQTGDTFPLFLNRGKDFEDVTGAWGLSGITAGLTAWGSGIADFDNDGWKDIFVACSAILDNSEEINHLPSKLPDKVLRNTGQHRFADVSSTAGPAFSVSDVHRGLALGDLNNDGRMDAVVTVQNNLPELLINRSPGDNHWLVVKLIGTKSNRDGLGARLTVLTSGGARIYNHASTSSGFGASSDPRVHFGLGASDKVELLEVRWPSGIVQRLTGLKANQIVAVREPAKTSEQR
ncbi:MAG: CRTAC1 family protein [Acidobacteriaceae bacterium]